jgi:hypothetical protein
VSGGTSSANPGRIARFSRAGYKDFVFAFHDGEEIGPKMLARIAKHTGITPMICKNEMPNNSLERSGVHGGRTVLTMNCVLAVRSGP